MADECSYLYLTDAEETLSALASLEGDAIVGLDTETYWEPGGKNSKVSLVQIAPRAGRVLVIDALAVSLELVQPLIDSPGVRMAAHNARFDERMLFAEGLRPAAFIDTLRLARSALRLPSYSLAAVSAHLLGIELDKSFQKSNWRRRPLTRAQIQYAAMDAQVVLQVYDELAALLQAEGKLETALRAAAIKPQTEETSSSGTARRARRIAPQVPARSLTDDERRMVASLKRWRMTKSLEMNRPVYMVCSDRTLEHLAMEQPVTLEAMQNIYGLGPSRVERFGEEILKILEDLKSEISDFKS